MRYGETSVSVSFDETTTIEDFVKLTKCFDEYRGVSNDAMAYLEAFKANEVHEDVRRVSKFMSQEVFHKYQSVMRLTIYF